MGEYYVDLHLHTKCSDGEQTPEQVMEAAQSAGMSCIALTDHNFFAIHEPVQKGDLLVIPGAEFSTTYKNKEIHVVGLFFNGVDPAIESIWSCIAKDGWIAAMIEQLNRLGIQMSMKELKEAYPESKRSNRTQVAELLVKKGYAKDKDDAMDRYVGNRSPYYINPVDFVEYIPLADCVRTIHKYGGIPILAHPFHYGYTNEQIEELVEEFRGIDDGPMAMEVYYSKYNEDERQYLLGLAGKYHLLPGVGSDRHKTTHAFAKGSAELLEQMKRAACENM